MIDISPKALRLAAELQPACASEPRVLALGREEADHRRKGAADRVKRYAQVSEGTAEFCVRAMNALLDDPGRFGSADWDGNDFAFMRSVADSLREQLDRSNAQVR